MSSPPAKKVRRELIRNKSQLLLFGFYPAIADFVSSGLKYAVG